MGNWHSLLVHLHFAEASSQVEVWYDGAAVGRLSVPDSFGTNLIGGLAFGEPGLGISYTMAFDNLDAHQLVSSPSPAPGSASQPAMPAPASAVVSAPSRTAFPNSTPAPRQTVPPN